MGGSTPAKEQIVELLTQLNQQTLRTKARAKTSNESMRMLKWRLSDVVYRTMVNDATHHIVTGP